MPATPFFVFLAAGQVRAGGRLSLRRGKMEPEAECRCGGAGCHSGGFLLRIMPPSWQPVPACVRHGHSAGGPFLHATTIVLQAEPIFFAATTIVLKAGRLSCSSDGAAGGTNLLCRNNESATGGPLLHTTTIVLHRFSSLGLKSRIDARKIV